MSSRKKLIIFKEISRRKDAKEKMQKKSSFLLQGRKGEKCHTMEGGRERQHPWSAVTFHAKKEKSKAARVT